jgi:hypothetical protein
MSGSITTAQAAQNAADAVLNAANAVTATATAATALAANAVTQGNITLAKIAAFNVGAGSAAMAAALAAAPTTQPSTAGVLWNNGGVLQISGGASS